MDIICIYGGTGIGKRTTGEELAKFTKYTLFHNHLTIDPAIELLPLRGKETFPIINRFRFALLRAAAKRKLPGVIVTAGTRRGQHNEWMNGLKRLNREKNINVHFVHIYADKKIHLTRVKGESRKKFNKTRDPKVVSEEIDSFDLTSPYTRGDLSINSTKLSAKQTAKIIYKELFN